MLTNHYEFLYKDGLPNIWEHLDPKNEEALSELLDFLERFRIRSPQDMKSIIDISDEDDIPDYITTP